jgi:nucleotide-binding universal stress UspA family protein
LIVMASHGAGAGGFSLFGSVADRVVRHAESPVYLVRDANVPAGGFVVALDGSDRAERALPLVVELAAALKRPLRLIRALDTKALERAARTGTHAGDRYARSSDVVRRSMTHYLDGVAASLSAQGLQVTTKVIDGSPAEAIAAETAPDEIVAITTRGQGGVERWLIGSVAAKLVRAVSGPLLIVR